MEFRFTPEQEAFRAEVRAFIREQLPQNWDEINLAGGDAAWQITLDFHRALAAKKWLAMAWPVESGGLAADIMTQLIYHEEMQYHAAPAFSMGVAWVGPALMMYGNDAQRERYLPRIASGEDVYCTLYSEPGAGSDLAALQTKAVADGSDFVISGQKIWTSGAHQSNLGWLAARTDPEAAKHKGISTFIIPMDLPGITIRPIINLRGQHDFNEVFFDEVRVPGDCLIGELGTGWRNITAALEFERSGIEWIAAGQRMLDLLLGAARERKAADDTDPQVRMELAQRAIEAEVGRLLCYRTADLQARHQAFTYETSASKVYNSELTQRIAGTGLSLFGMAGNIAPGNEHAPLGGQLTHALLGGYLWGIANTIGAGSSEIQRNIIATRGLGLPR